MWLICTDALACKDWSLRYGGAVPEKSEELWGQFDLALVFNPGQISVEREIWREVRSSSALSPSPAIHTRLLHWNPKYLLRLSSWSASLSVSCARSFVSIRRLVTSKFVPAVHRRSPIWLAIAVMHVPDLFDWWSIEVCLLLICLPATFFGWVSPPSWLIGHVVLYSYRNPPQRWTVLTFAFYFA